MAGGIVQDAVKSWEARLKELSPVVEEAREIEEALARQKGESNGGASAAAPAPQRSTPQRRSRKRKGGKRADQFVKLVEEHPGITVSEIAKKMNINPNYIYRIAADQVQAGAVAKEDKGYVKASS